MDDKTALAFNTICNFIRDLNGSFGNRQKSLLLYGHLIEKTGLIHMEPVRKHIQIFKTFVQTNDEAIQGRDKKKMRLERIVYSDKVAIDIKSIFQMADKDEENVIWVHLLTISALLFPEGQAKQKLKELREQASSRGASGGNGGGGGIGGGGGDFIKNMMDKIGEQIQNTDGDDVNPMQMIGSLMNSGVFNELFQGLSGQMGGGGGNGGMDLAGMMSSMQGLLNNISTMANEQEDQVKTTTETTNTTTPTASLPNVQENPAEGTDEQ
jgi:hypothetical protein